MWARLALARDEYYVDAAVGNAWLRLHHVDSSVLFEKKRIRANRDGTEVRTALRRRPRLP